MTSKKSIPSCLGEADIRPAFKRWLLSRYADRPGTQLIDELGIRGGQVRIDVALVNGAIHGYEIKSDLDSLSRLPSQIEHYNLVLDSATLVVTSRHLADAIDALPPWWGVVAVSAAGRSPTFTQLRRAAKNPSRNARALAEFLWLNEALSLLEQHGLDRGVRSKPRRYVWDRISDQLSVEVIASAVRDALRARTGPSALRLQK